MSTKIDEIKAQCVGRWPGILQQLGIDVGEGKHIQCPICKCEKKWFRFDNKDGNGTWICNHCGAGDAWHLVQKVLNVDFMGAVEVVAPFVDKVPVAAVVERDEKISKEYLREIYVGSVKAHESNLVGRYLAFRGLSVFPSALRLHQGLKEPDSGKVFPCMLGLLSMPDGTGVTMHRTWIVEPGQKAPVEKPKKLLPGLKKICGAAIRLWPIPETGPLGIAEGIETAIACHELYQIPVWSAVSSNGVETWVPPKGITSVVVFGDNDKNYTGQKAAYHLANRLVVQHGLTAEVEIPDEGDFLDVLNKQRGA